MCFRPPTAGKKEIKCPRCGAVNLPDAKKCVSAAPRKRTSLLPLLPHRAGAAPFAESASAQAGGPPGPPPGPGKEPDEET